MLDEFTVMQSADSGIPPLNLVKYCVRNCATNVKVAYRTKIVINSPQLGVLTEDQYGVTAEKTGQDIEITRSAFAHVADAINSVIAKKTQIEWISVPCPLNFLKDGGLPDAINKVFTDDRQRSMLCLEFPMKLLYDDTGKFADALNKVKCTGAKTMLAGFGGANCPSMRLLDYRFNYVILDDRVTSLMENEETARSAELIAQFSDTSKSQFIVNGVKTAELIERWYKSGSYGFIGTESPSDLIEYERQMTDESV